MECRRALGAGVGAGARTPDMTLSGSLWENGLGLFFYVIHSKITLLVPH